ncbi:MAG: thioredoxin family protein [candidate division Zixibacteria bacterium]|jgi:small redox-active disulfide protein 2|nr:thioredoxin family protein [candidate division Zixibacteria bacterium]
MKIEVLGTGCSRCKQLHENTMQAVIAADVEADVSKVEDITEIMRYGVMSTPALVIDGVVKTVGKVPSVDEIKKLLK